MSSLFKAEFKMRQLDGFLGKWLSEGLTKGEHEEWTRILTYDSKFREEFCDWVKALRDPAWSKTANRGPRP